jgi:hypothetical protein
LARVRSWAQASSRKQRTKPESRLTPVRSVRAATCAFSIPAGPYLPARQRHHHRGSRATDFDLTHSSPAVGCPERGWGQRRW